jgi:hypothetical protein
MAGPWRGAAVLACAALSLGVADAAQAGTATGRPAQFTAAPGERNDLTVDAGPGGSAQFSDAGGAIGLGLFCLPIPLGQAQCDPDGDARDTDGGGVVVDLADGDDRATIRGLPGTGVHPGSIRVAGGPGDDDLSSTAPSAFVRFEGGDGDDKLVAGPDGSALLLGGTGADLMASSATCCMTASYEDHDATGVRVTLDDKANDGATGEGDDVRTDTVLGGPGPDTITGNAGANSLIGAGGADVLDGAGGDDAIDATAQYAGLGTIPDAADSVRCGAGNDTVRADPGDRTALDCETIHVGGTPRPELVFSLGPARATRAGVLSVTFRVKFPEAGSTDAARSTFRLLDSRGRRSSSTAKFVLGGAANVAHMKIRLSPSARRRLARSRAGRLHLFAQRVSRDARAELAPAGYDRINAPVTIRRARKR